MRADARAQREHSRFDTAFNPRMIALKSRLGLWLWMTTVSALSFAKARIILSLYTVIVLEVVIPLIR